MGSQIARNLIIGVSFVLLTWGIVGSILSTPSPTQMSAAQEASSPLTSSLATIEVGVAISAWTNITTQWADFVFSWAQAATSNYWDNSMVTSFDLGVMAVAFGTVSLHRQRDKRAVPLREQILSVVTMNPGIHLRELHRELGCAMGALQYHLRILEREGQIVSLRNGNSRHFFTPDFSSEERVQRLAAMARNPVVNSILSECAKNGLTTQAEISRSLNIDKSLVSYYVTGLLKAGVLNPVKVFGRERPVILSDWARSTIDAEVY